MERPGGGGDACLVDTACRRGDAGRGDIGCVYRGDGGGRRGDGSRARGDAPLEPLADMKGDCGSVWVDVGRGESVSLRVGGGQSKKGAWKWTVNSCWQGAQNDAKPNEREPWRTLMRRVTARAPRSAGAPRALRLRLTAPRGFPCALAPVVRLARSATESGLRHTVPQAHSAAESFRALRWAFAPRRVRPATYRVPVKAE